MSNKKTDSITKDVERYFGFLMGKGSRIRSVEYSPQFFGNWVAELESSACVIFITSDRDHLLLELASKKDVSGKSRMTLERVIYEMSNGKIVVEPFKGNLAWGQKKQLERLSGLLAKHIDEILPCFNNESGKFLLVV